MKTHIRSQIEIVAINEVEHKLNQIKNECFTKSELVELNHKHIQTMAGYYAIKIALKNLIDQLYPLNNISEKQIILSHNPNGAPCIDEIISLSNDATYKFQISISHTSENAYGFVAIMETN